MSTPGCGAGPHALTHTPMVAAYSPDLRERIVQFYYRGRTMREVADVFNVSLGFVHHVVNLYRTHGQATDPYPQPRCGHRRTLTFEHENYIRDLVEVKPSIYLDKIQEKLATEHGVDISLATISRTFTRMRYSKKSLSRRAKERNEELRILWELEIAELNDPDFFVFVDESAVDNRTAQRSSGWSPVGSRSVSRCAFFRGKRHSILPALSSDGIIALDIFEGSVNKERFLRFLREQVVRLSCGSYPSGADFWHRLPS